MGKRYCLPLVAMVEITRSSPNCVLLQSQLASLPGVSKRKCVAQVILGQGVIHTCTIREEAGRVLAEQQKAYDALARCGDLHWEVVPAPDVVSSSGYLNSVSASSITSSSGSPNTAPSSDNVPPSGYPNTAPNFGNVPPSGYPNTAPNFGNVPSSGYPSMGPNFGNVPSSGYPNTAPHSGGWGRTPGISHMPVTPWSVPRPRVTPIPREILAPLPHAYRAVLMLVDGKRSLEEIAQLLNKAPQEIQQILVNLPDIVQM